MPSDSNPSRPSEFIPLRIDPRTRFRLDMASRMRFTSFASYLEWAVELSFWRPENAVTSHDGQIVTLAEAEGGESELWHKYEIDRFLNVALRIPEVLTPDESHLLEVILEIFGWLEPTRRFRTELDYIEFLRSNQKLIFAGADHQVCPSAIAQALDGDPQVHAQLLRHATQECGPFKRRRASGPLKGERKKPAKDGVRLEIMSVGVPPRTRFRLEIASRMQRRSIASYMQWAMEESFSHPALAIPSRDGRAITLAEVESGEGLWNVDDVDCFLNVAQRLPQVLTPGERHLLQTVKETFGVMTPPRRFRDDVGDRELLKSEADLIYAGAENDYAPSRIAQALDGDSDIREEIERLIRADYGPFRPRRTAPKPSSRKTRRQKINSE